jgi:putative transposase
VERKEVLRILHDPEHVDEAPATVYAKLLDAGVYLCSVPTMYRILRAEGEVAERRRQASHPADGQARAAGHPAQPGLVLGHHQAGRPGQVDLVLPVHDHRHLQPLRARLAAGSGRAGPLAERLLADTIAHQHVDRGELTIHADRGSSMASKPAAFLLADLGVTKSQSRPHCSNDNPYSEARFKTLKYRPEFPDRFGCYEDALAFCRRFFGWYNAEHRHSGIGFHTPPMSTTGGPNRSGPSGPGCWTPPTPPIPSGSSPSRQYHPSCPPWRGSTNPRRGRSTQRIPDQPASQEVDSFRSPGHQLSSHSPGAS